MTKRENNWLKTQKQKKFMRQMKFHQDKCGNALNRIADMIRKETRQTA
jgi:hypothetical protein